MKQNFVGLKELETQYNLKSHFHKIQQNYSADINMALYMDLSDIEKLQIFQIIQVSEMHHFLVNFYGFRMNLQDQLTEKLYKLFIRQMDGILRTQTSSKYTVIVFQPSSESKSCFDTFKQIYKRLPGQYFTKLNKIYRIKSGFLIKAFSIMQFTSWSKMFNKFVQYAQKQSFENVSLQDLLKLKEIKNFNILLNCPKQITNNIQIKEEALYLIKSAFVGSKKSKPFDSLKKDFQDYALDQKHGVPLVLSILIETMKSNRQLCLTEGIFRIAGSIEDEQELLKTIIELKTFRLLDCQVYCKRSIAGLMKRIFTQSLTPLIPYTVYNHILNQHIDQTNIRCFWEIIVQELPQLNRTILCYVTDFLRDFILSNKQINKMGPHNLAVIFNPCFFRAKECNLADLLNSGKFAAFYKWWLEHYDEIIKKQINSEQKKKVQEATEQYQLQRRINLEIIKYQGSLFRPISGFYE